MLVDLVDHNYDYATATSGDLTMDVSSNYMYSHYLVVCTILDNECTLAYVCTTKFTSTDQFIVILGVCHRGWIYYNRPPPHPLLLTPVHDNTLAYSFDSSTVFVQQPGLLDVLDDLGGEWAQLRLGRRSHARMVGIVRRQRWFRIMRVKLVTESVPGRE